MINIDLMLEMGDLNIDILNELYVGETSFIKDLIEEVSKARAPYVGKIKKPIKGNKDFIRIGDMIADQFGFRSVTFMVPYDAALNAYTHSITRSFDKSIYGIKPKFNKDTGFKYEVTGLSTIIAVTAGVWFNKEFTDREIVAAILHEVGHSFTLQSDRLIQLIEITRITNIVLLTYQTIMDVYTMNIQNVPNDISQMINSSNMGKEIINRIAKECANNPLFAGFNGLLAIEEYITGIITRFFKEVSALLSSYSSLMAIPSTFINKIIATIFKPFTSSARAQEYLSDSFATMYGLGPEISSFLTKIEYNPSASGSYIEKMISTTPIIGAMNEAIKIPILMIMHGSSVHPSTPARMDKIISELNKELNNSDLNPKTKVEIKKHINEIENIKDEFLNTTKNQKYDAEMVKRAWMSYVSTSGEVYDSDEQYYTDLDNRTKYMK